MKSTVLLIFVLMVLNVPLVFGQGSIMLAGGGSEGSGTWAVDAYGWFVQRADSGKIINIDVDPAAPGYALFFISLGADSSSHPMQIPDSATANDSATYYELISASGIFIEGGDQWDYIRTWQGTLVVDAITYVFNQGGAIGGTSAGLAVLGDVVYDSRNGSAYPAGVAYNPYIATVTFTDDFLHILPNVLPDSHFLTRSRLGRLVPMLGRRIQDYGDDDLMGVGVEEQAAFCIEPDLMATVYGRAVTIIYRTEESTIVCEPERPITFTNVVFHQLLEGAVFDLANRVLIDPGEYIHENTAFPPGPPVFADTSIDGHLESAAELGQIVITGMNTDPNNWRNGLLGQEAGTGLIPYSVIIPQLYREYAFWANHWVGGEWGAATNPYYYVIYLDINSESTISSGVMTVGTLTYVLDTYHATHLGVNDDGIPGIVNGMLHFLANGDTINLRNLFIPSSVPENPVSSPNEFRFLGNYPNPFNPVTTIEFSNPRLSRVNLYIFDITGRKVVELLNEVTEPGTHQVVWDAKDLPSGIYFVRMSVRTHTGEATGFQKTQKVVLLK